MHDATASGHPLHAAGAQQPAVALVVTMAHAARKHVGHRLEAAMRVIREAGQIIVRVVRTKLVEHQERIDVRQHRRADQTRQADTRPITGRRAAHHLGNAALVTAVLLRLNLHFAHCGFHDHVLRRFSDTCTSMGVLRKRKAELFEGGCLDLLNKENRYISYR